MIDIINTILNLVPQTTKHKKYKNVILNNNFKIKIFGTLETCSKVLVVGHGLGGTKDSFYVKSLVNKFSNIDEIAIVTLDAPGIKDNIKSEYICGPSETRQNAYIDEIIDYIKCINNDCELYAAGFSAGALYLFTYLTCTQNIVRNKNRENIKHSFLISMPALEFDELLEWIEKNSKLKVIVSLGYSFYLINYLVMNKKTRDISNVLKYSFNIKKLINSLERDAWYRHEFNEPRKLNATFFYSKKDPIVGYHLDNKNIISKHSGYKVFEFFGGGHCSFMKLNGKRAHEEIIYNHLVK